ncbi:MAG: hypothetical protein ACK5LG_21800 [Bacteroides thetaiotaomicron]
MPSVDLIIFTLRFQVVGATVVMFSCDYVMAYAISVMRRCITLFAIPLYYCPDTGRVDTIVIGYFQRVVAGQDLEWEWLLLDSSHVTSGLSFRYRK